MDEHAVVGPPKSFDELKARALEYGKSRGPARLAVAAAADVCALEAAYDAWELGLVQPVLVGQTDEITSTAERAGVDVSGWSVVSSDDPVTSAAKAVELVREGEADFLMKGRVNTAALMRAVLDKERGIRAGKLMSHIAIMEIPVLGRLICMSDGGIVLSPTLDEKADIIRNAVWAMHHMGWECPKVAVVCALEQVNPAMPQTVDAAILAKMNDRGQITGCVVDGPFGLDNAISEVAAKRKGVKSPLAGKAELLIFHDIDVGNVFYKALYFLAEGVKCAGVLVGSKVPIVFPSRADARDTKRNSIVAATLISHASGGAIAAASER